MAPDTQLQTQYDLFLKVLMMLNALAPVLCLIAIVAGVALILRRNTWGYYIIFVALAGIAVHLFFRS